MKEATTFEIDMNKKYSKLIVAGKLILGLSLIAVLVSRANITAVLKSFASIDLRFAVLVFVFPHIGILISTIKWDMLLKKVSVNINFSRLLGLYFMGTFFSVFLPTMIGGDIVRVYQLTRDSKNALAIIAATFMERFIGLAALVSLLPLCLLQDPVSKQWPLIGLVVGMAIAIYMAAVFLIFFDVDIPGTQVIQALPLAGKLMFSIENARNQIRVFSHSRRILFAAYVISIIFYFIAAASSWAATMSTGAGISYSYLISVVPMILLGGMLPISLNGLGITEFGYVLFLELVGVQVADAVAAAFLLRIRLLFTALIGGGLYVIWKPRPMSLQAKIKYSQDV